MASPGDYWSFFVFVEELSLRSLLHALRDPSPTNPIYVGLWTIAILYGLEFLVPWRRGQRKLREGLLLDLCHTAFSLVLFLGLFGMALGRTAELALHHALQAGLGLQLSVQLPLEGLPSWLRYLLLFLFVDFLGYWGHRLLHRSSLLWTFHQVHHSSRRLDVLNAVRLHWVEKLFYRLFTYVPTVLVGFGVTEVIGVAFVRLLLSNYTHANLNLPLGPLRYVVNNPQLHIWHHAVEVDARRNVNYGDALSAWDYLFGTAYLPDDRSELELGFEGVEVFPNTFLGQQLHPLGRILPERLRRGLAGEGEGSRQLPRLVRRTAPTLVTLLLGASLLAALPGTLVEDYRAEVGARLAQGRAADALALLERVSPFDSERLGMLRRMQLLNREAGYQSPAMQGVGRAARADAALRFRVGRDLLRAGEALGDADLARSARNAEVLVGLEPRSARSHALRGATLLRVAARSGSARERAEAVASFERAIELDPDHEGARRALREIESAAR